jgi:hypothetical protein
MAGDDADGGSSPAPEEPQMAAPLSPRLDERSFEGDPEGKYTSAAYTEDSNEYRLQAL